MARIRKVTSEAKVGNLEDAARRDEEIVGFQVAVQDVVPVTKLESTKGHSDPRFDIRREEDESTIFDDLFEVGCKEFENQIQVLFVGEDVKKLVIKSEIQTT
jgi:hypothetical protein